jgi:aminoglycoside phosphotransferase (APT) family kinase protein
VRLWSLWVKFRELPRSRRGITSNGDPIPANLLVRSDRLIGVLDGGSFAAADPSLDLAATWHLLDRDAGHTFRIELDCEWLEWCRGAAWALVQATGLALVGQRCLVMGVCQNEVHLAKAQRNTGLFAAPDAQLGPLLWAARGCGSTEPETRFAVHAGPNH